MIEITGKPTIFEASSKKKPVKSVKPVEPGPGDPTYDLIKKIADESKVTKRPTVITTPPAGKGGTGTKTPDGSGGPAKDQ